MWVASSPPGYQLWAITITKLDSCGNFLRPDWFPNISEDERRDEDVRFLEDKEDSSMGGVSSIPAVVGQLATRLLYYLSGMNYNQHSISQPHDSHNHLLVRWKGRDFHVYDRMGWV